MENEYIGWYEAKSTNANCVLNYTGCGGEVRYVSDPFQHEMNDRVCNMPICEYCYQSLLGDI